MNLNAKVNKGMRAMFDEMNRHTEIIARAYLEYDKATDRDEKASLVAKIAASGVQIAKAWAGMITLGQVGAMLGLDPRAAIDATASEKDDGNTN